MSLMLDFVMLIYGPPARVQALLAEEWLREGDGSYRTPLRHAEWRRPPRHYKTPMDVLRVTSTDCARLYPNDLWNDGLVPLAERLLQRQHLSTPDDIIHFEAAHRDIENEFGWTTAGHHEMLLRRVVTEIDHTADPDREVDAQRLAREGVHPAGPPLMNRTFFDDVTRPGGCGGLFAPHRAWVVE